MSNSGAVLQPNHVSSRFVGLRDDTMHNRGSIPFGHSREMNSQLKSLHEVARDIFKQKNTHVSSSLIIPHSLSYLGDGKNLCSTRGDGSTGNGIISGGEGMFKVPSNRSSMGKKVSNGLAFLLVVAASSALSIFAYNRYFVDEISTNSDVVVRTGYSDAYWQTYGEVFEPMVSVPVYYPEIGYKDEEFLLDSGAVVSSLPRERASELGLSLAHLPRIVFGGFGGTTSFGYQSDLRIKVGSDEIEIPVVFTEAEGTKSILGRSGFFERYSVIFYAKSRTILIIK